MQPSKVSQAGLERYDPKDRILDLTSLHSDELTPAFKGVTRRPETLAIVHNTANTYFGFMRRVPCCPYRLELIYVTERTSFNLLHAKPPLEWENVSR
jgi:hypothetical protein